jgi:hypothetical protein
LMWRGSWAFYVTHTCPVSLEHFLSTHMEFSEMEHWPHTEHINVWISAPCIPSTHKKSIKDLCSSLLQTKNGTAIFPTQQQISHWEQSQDHQSADTSRKQSVMLALRHWLYTSDSLRGGEEAWELFEDPS